MRHFFFIFFVIFFNVTWSQSNAALEIVYPITGITTYSQDLSQEIVIQSSSPLTSITVNGSPATLRFDNGYSVSLFFTESGIKNLAVVAIDENGISSELNSTFDFQYDAQAPIISAGQPSAVSNSQSVILSASVTDSSPVRLSVYRNSTIVYSEDSGSLNQSFQLQEGNNIFKIVALDRAGNQSRSTGDLWDCRQELEL
ncbi:MAG: hypothetical protein K2Q26_08880 [Bdellovibrionales bacterium]|nr:hypothetical protein [Bdellovibrionales bacterium]